MESVIAVIAFCVILSTTKISASNKQSTSSNYAFKNYEEIGNVEARAENDIDIAHDNVKSTINKRDIIITGGIIYIDGNYAGDRNVSNRRVEQIGDITYIYSNEDNKSKQAGNKVNPFKFARQIKAKLETENLSTDARNNLNRLKAHLPLIVRAIVWGEKVYLFSKIQNEVFFAVKDQYAYDQYRRSVYTWRPGGGADSQGQWEFSSTDGNKYLMRNVHFDEYLYAAYNDLAYDNKRRRVFTWDSPCSDEECYWTIELLNKYDIKLSNYRYNEHLIAAGDQYAAGSQSRNVFTWRPGPLTTDQSVWRVQLA